MILKTLIAGNSIGSLKLPFINTFFGERVRIDQIGLIREMFDF
jgi:hypothetical protein